MKIQLSIKTTRARSTTRKLASRIEDVVDNWCGYPEPQYEIINDAAYGTCIDYTTGSGKGNYYITPRTRKARLIVLFEGYRGSFYGGTHAFSLKDILEIAGATPDDIRVTLIESSEPERPVTVEWEHYKNYLSITKEEIELLDIPLYPMEEPESQYSSKPADGVVAGL